MSRLVTVHRPFPAATTTHTQIHRLHIIISTSLNKVHFWRERLHKNFTRQQVYYTAKTPWERPELWQDNTIALFCSHLSAPSSIMCHSFVSLEAAKHSIPVLRCRNRSMQRKAPQCLSMYVWDCVSKAGGKRETVGYRLVIVTSDTISSRSNRDEVCVCVFACVWSMFT